MHRYVSSRLRMEEIVRRKEEKKDEPRWFENSKVPTPAKYNPQYYQKQEFDNHWLDIGCNVFYKGKIGKCNLVTSITLNLNHIP